MGRQAIIQNVKKYVSWNWLERLTESTQCDPEFKELSIASMVSHVTLQLRVCVTSQMLSQLASICFVGSHHRTGYSSIP